ncbi:MAG: DUF3078 domain-containing protein [Prolixibacteraceae bacterium]|jgi:hypothetical protein|nr:DUF3078 domain-containing protein [Prolixibacteraceae bacterium]
MYKISILVLLIIIVNPLFSQENSDTTYWKKSGDFAINFSQVSFTNWAAGGQNAVAGVSKLNYTAKYLKGNMAWDNLLNVGYGLSKVEGLEIQKSEDIIDLQSKLGIKASEKWFYSASLAFLSQFAPGYSDASNTLKISNLFAPASLNLAIGMDYKASDKFSVLLAPLTGKMTMIFDEDIDATNYGLEAAGATTRLELGASIKAMLKTKIVKNVEFASELGLFSNYLDNPQNIDVDWKVGITMKINEFLSAKVDTRLLYDADILDPVDQTAKIQFMELLGIGLNLTF